MMSSLTLLVIGALTVAAPAAAQPIDWEHAPRITVALESYRFEPATISMRHGEPYVLAFVNKAGGGHNFVAKQFFAGATVSDADRSRIGKGAVSLDGGQSVEICVSACKWCPPDSVIGA